MPRLDDLELTGGKRYKERLEEIRKLGPKDGGPGDKARLRLKKLKAP